MKKEDYYALINYKGKQKYYYVSASESSPEHPYDLRVEYIDYNPKREWPGVWITDGKSKVIKKFDSSTEEYKYFKDLEQNWKILMVAFAELQKGERYTLEFIPPIGTSNAAACFKKALKQTPNVLNIKI